MPVMTIIPFGDNAWPDLSDFIHLAEGSPPIQVAMLRGGMVSGLPSIAIRLDLPDGRVVVAETSMHLWVQAARLFSGIHYLDQNGITDGEGRLLEVAEHFGATHDDDLTRITFKRGDLLTMMRVMRGGER